MPLSGLYGKLHASGAYSLSGTHVFIHTYIHAYTLGGRGREIIKNKSFIKMMDEHQIQSIHFQEVFNFLLCV